MIKKYQRKECLSNMEIYGNNNMMFWWYIFFLRFCWFSYEIGLQLEILFLSTNESNCFKNIYMWFQFFMLVILFMMQNIKIAWYVHNKDLSLRKKMHFMIYKMISNAEYQRKRFHCSFISGLFFTKSFFLKDLNC